MNRQVICRTDLTPEQRQAVLRKALEEIKASRKELNQEMAQMGWRSVKVKKNWRKSR